ncbi:dUTP diphosphatase [Candidatus Parcubacteria bacterium]|nr:dUTP diphosphatase [Candidatus Parcubacteria bacterium]
MLIKIKKLHKEAKLPTYGHPGDAGMDIYALAETAVPANGTSKIKTGIAIEIPEGYVALCWDKSGLSLNEGIKVIGGVFDSGYRGEYIVGVYNMKDEPFVFGKGQKIMQVLVQPVVAGEILEVDELSESSGRGESGRGSTGLH